VRSEDLVVGPFSEPIGNHQSPGSSVGPPHSTPDTYRLYVGDYAAGCILPTTLLTKDDSIAQPQR
jgi:hypothetical protein